MAMLRKWQGVDLHGTPMKKVRSHALSMIYTLRSQRAHAKTQKPGKSPTVAFGIGKGIK